MGWVRATRDELVARAATSAGRRRLAAVLLVGLVLGAALGGVWSASRPDRFAASAIVFAEPLVVPTGAEGGRSVLDPEAQLDRELVVSRRSSLNEKVRRSFRDADVSDVAVRRGSAPNTLRLSATARSARDAADAVNLYVSSLIELRRTERIRSTLDAVEVLQDRIGAIDAALAGGGAGAPADGAAEGSASTTATTVDAAALRAERARLVAIGEELSGASPVLSAADVRVVEPAQVPRNAEPKPVALAAGLGAIGGGAVALLAEAALGRRRQLAASARIRLAGREVPILTRSSSPTGGTGLEGPWSAAATALRLRPEVRPGYVIALAAAEPDTGCTAATARLAAALASEGRHVVAIDTDVRRPSLHRSFAVSNRAGLLDVARGDRWLSPVVQEADSGVDVIPVGASTDGGTTLLASRAVGAAVQACAETYDSVLLDTPPLASGEAATLAVTLADGAVLVGRLDRAGRRRLETGADALREAGVPLLGVVVVRGGSGAGGGGGARFTSRRRPEAG
jgi:Mrp family chromosome partitioning ATPase